MAEIDYMQHEIHLERSRRTEDDLRQRLRERLRKAAEAKHAHRVLKPDPVAKRLGFLVAKAGKRRQALEGTGLAGYLLIRKGQSTWNCR